MGVIILDRQELKYRSFMGARALIRATSLSLPLPTPGAGPPPLLSQRTSPQFPSAICLSNQLLWSKDVAERAFGVDFKKRLYADVGQLGLQPVLRRALLVELVEAAEDGDNFATSVDRITAEPLLELLQPRLNNRASPLGGHPRPWQRVCAFDV